MNSRLAKVMVLMVWVISISFTLSSVAGAPTVQSGNVDFALIPAVIFMIPGDVVDVTIQFDPAANPVAAVQAYLNFDPTLIELVDSAGNPATRIGDSPLLASNDWVILQDNIDNVAGTIDFAAGRKPVTGQDATTLTTLATITVKAIAPSPGTNITFSVSVPRQTKAVSGFNDVTGALNDTHFSIANINNVTLTFSIQGHATNGGDWTMPVEVEMYAAGTSNMVVSGTPISLLTSNSDSSVILPGVPDGTYDIWFKGDNTLSRLMPSVVISPSATNVIMASQIGGDASGDNLVDIEDYSTFLLIPIGTLTSALSAAQQRQDHNRDGFIDVTDYLVIVNNFGQQGATKP